MMAEDTIYYLKNTIQPYSWGHPKAMGNLFSIANPEHLPQAEMWMGAHEKAPSFIQRPQAMNTFISENPEQILGPEISSRFGGKLPFLFKLLSAEKPLSIQAHPNKKQAELGFAKENAQGIAITAKHRNYRDDNHKPELIYALTTFKAMNGFRAINEIIRLFNLIENSMLNAWVSELQLSKDNEGLKNFYQNIMQLQGSEKQELIKDALKAASKENEIALRELEHLYQYYPMDIGVFSPLLLNVVTLAPGEAMFLKAGTLHAYLQGTGLEIMASSDNVLRGGLTEKHTDIKELIDVIEFEPIDKAELTVRSINCVNQESFPVPVSDFTFDIINTFDSIQSYKCHSAEILFCIQGAVTVCTSAGQFFALQLGQSCLVTAQTGGYSMDGVGRVARASA
jgi:mannose-6-phosphate isomerase